MRPWALALSGSLALHLAAVAAFRAEEVTPVPAAKVEQRGEGFVSFTAVSLVAKQLSPPAKVVAAAVRAVKPAAVPESADPNPDRSSRAESRDEAELEAGAPAGEPSPSLGPTGDSQAEASSAPGPPSGGTADEVIALVHARLAAVADRCYPAAARRFQQRGTVQLSFCTDVNGGTAKARVTQSSGAELLDAAARGCVLENAVPFPREASARCFSVPVRFGLFR